MVVDSILPHAEIGWNNHRKDATPFTRNKVVSSNFYQNIEGVKFEWKEYLTLTLVKVPDKVPGISLICLSEIVWLFIRFKMISK